MKAIVGTKKGMTQVFDADGVCHPGTVLSVAPMVVTQVRTSDRDGYEAVQLASESVKANRLNKAQKGHHESAHTNVVEFRPQNGEDSLDAFGDGETVDVSQFEVGDTVMVSAISKGKGFQGVVKRHGFKGAASKTHGTKHTERAPGSIGATGIARVLKGTRMAGRMGGDRVTVKNLKVLQVNPEEGVLVLKGAVPGPKGGIVEVRAKSA